ncbi:NMN adenylyl transferase [Vibrio phage VCPH]|nr:NMN adenylyl transferase [Vibrio phage VCPH]
MANQSISQAFVHAFVICRLQGLHKGHLYLLETAANNSERLTVIIGSSNKSKAIKNPWTAAERYQMTYVAMLQHGIDMEKVDFVGLPDYDYNDDIWENELHAIIKERVQDTFQPVIFTSAKGGDDQLRHAWARDMQVANIGNPPEEVAFSATDVRKAILQGDTDFLAKACTEHVVGDLLLETGAGYEGTQALKRKRVHQMNDASIWKGTPYAVIKCATDNVVVDATGENVLLVRRGENSPGAGLWALPGGHLEPDLDELQNALKELNEEANLVVKPEFCIAQARFTDPDRCEIGRMTSTAFAFMIDQVKPEVYSQPGEDTDMAKWFPVADVANLDMYDDHFGMLLTILRQLQPQQ